MNKIPNVTQYQLCIVSRDIDAIIQFHTFECTQIFRETFAHLNVNDKSESIKNLIKQLGEPQLLQICARMLTALLYCIRCG